MKAKQIFLLSMLFSLACSATAQDTAFRKPGLALETRITTYLQGGYDLGIFYHPRNTRLSIGIFGANHDITGMTKEWVFSSNNHDNLDIQLNWLFSLMTRYHLAEHGEGFFAELGLGMEEFKVSASGQSIANTNGFVSPSVGYTWYPWKRSGLYIMPKLTANFILFREEEQTIHTSTFRLKQVFAAPSFAIGWKFDFR